MSVGIPETPVLGNEPETATFRFDRFYLHATRFEWPGAAIMSKQSDGGWIVTDGEGCRTSRHAGMGDAIEEVSRLCWAADVARAKASGDQGAA